MRTYELRDLSSSLIGSMQVSSHVRMERSLPPGPRPPKKSISPSLLSFRNERAPVIILFERNRSRYRRESYELTFRLSSLVDRGLRVPEVF